MPGLKQTCRKCALHFDHSNMLLCHMRITDETVWQLLTNHNLKKVGNETTSRLHAQILMAGRYAETL